MRISLPLILFIIIFFNGTGANLDKPQHQTSDVEGMLKDFEAAMAYRDIDKIMSFFAEDCLVDDFTFQGAKNQGKAEVKASLRESFHAFPDLKITNKTQIISGNRVAIEFAVTGTHTGSSFRGPATGKYISFPAAGFVEIQDGRIKRYRGYYDRMTMLNQLGMRLVPQP